MTRCVVIDVDGSPVRIQLAPGYTEDDLTKEEREALQEIIKAVRAKKKSVTLNKPKRKIKIVRSKGK